jgi:uncharacterized membrane protein YgdD (TMEM256/DUF423 family)
MVSIVHPKTWIIVAAFLGATGVAVGAYHAHGLRGLLERQGLAAEEVGSRMETCAVAVRYQMYHALALLGVGALAARQRSVGLTASGGLFVLGTLLFSGMLYRIVFSDSPVHWAIVPIGGLILILAWITLAAAGLSYGPKRVGP